MLATRPPPAIRLGRTAFKPKTYYTIHSHPNNVFTIKPGEQNNFSVVGFRRIDDALLVGKMLQAYQLRMKEFPSPEPDGTLTLVNAPENQNIVTLSIREWGGLDELQFYCTRYILSMISVERINKSKSEKYTLDGALYTFDAPVEFYQTAFEELFNLN
jgi:hypothetical protein